LYYSDIDKAQKYYSRIYESVFGEKVETLLKKVGETRLEYTALPLCCYEELFQWNGQAVKTELGGTANKQRLFQELLTNIIELSK
jgi:hypothetical protein